MALTLARKEYVLQTRYYCFSIDDSILELLNKKLERCYIGSKIPVRATYDTLIMVWESDHFIEDAALTEKSYKIGEEITSAFWIIWDYIMHKMNICGYDIDDEMVKHFENFVEDCTV